MTSVGWSVLNVGLILAIDDNLPSVSLAFWPQVSWKMNAEWGNKRIPVRKLFTLWISTCSSLHPTGKNSNAFSWKKNPSSHVSVVLLSLTGNHWFVLTVTENWDPSACCKLQLLLYTWVKCHKDVWMVTLWIAWRVSYINLKYLYVWLTRKKRNQE